MTELLALAAAMVFIAHEVTEVVARYHADHNWMGYVTDSIYEVEKDERKWEG